MANPNESEHDRQFREDLEKATALSMETLALDQFRRNKLYRSDSISEQHSNSLYGSSCMYPLYIHIEYPHCRLYSLKLFFDQQLNLIVAPIPTIKVYKTRQVQAL